MRFDWMLGTNLSSCRMDFQRGNCRPPEKPTTLLFATTPPHPHQPPGPPCLPCAPPALGKSLADRRGRGAAAHSRCRTAALL